jgi:hypothetical protein
MMEAMFETPSTRKKSLEVSLEYAEKQFSKNQGTFLEGV